MKQLDDKQTQQITAETPEKDVDLDDGGAMTHNDIFADLEATLDEVADANPRIADDTQKDSARDTDLRTVLEMSMAVNSSLVLDDVLQLVMRKAIELMQAERGLIMLLNDDHELQVRAAYNLCNDEVAKEDFRISRSIARQVVETGKSVYTSDAQADDRYANQESIIELHLRSIMCVPIKVKGSPIGVIYLDNSSQARMFLKSDLYLFELYAQMVSNALHNASIYNSLLRLQRYTDSVVENSPVGIVVLDAQGRILTINPTGLEIFDLNRDNIRTVLDEGKSSRFLDTLPKKEQVRWQNMLNMVLTTGEEIAKSRYYHDTGYLEKVLSLKISPLADLPNGGDGLVMAVEDITEKVTMEQYVILSEKLVARGEMAASVAHELNNYLSIITNNAELLAMNVEREKYDKAKFNCRSISDNVFKIKRFVDSLMDFSKPEVDYINYDIKHLVDDLLFSLRIQPRFKLIHFTIDLANDLPTAEIDVGQIQQVLLNLLNNAADAIEERMTQIPDEADSFKREITIRAGHEPDTDTVYISITDNGTGMPEETRNKIFTLHFTTKKGGHGLGLYNCKTIAEQHGGELTVESQAGEGTTFRLTLPRFHPKDDNE
ncbi:MAG: GAF domain-containing protein [candidate division Zixibacteria bacterium]|nr:GAF domain-containing protein [candidate division Zixibacteria bacterium]